jgi:hypothetical protein
MVLVEAALNARRAKGKVMVRASCECGVCANARITEMLRAARRVCLAAAAVERQQPCKVTESKSTDAGALHFSVTLTLDWFYCWI